MFLEDYEKTFLQVEGGVPPYLWIEGGKGQLQPQGTERDQIRYSPGDIIGPEIITVYDSTGHFIDIQVTVNGVFRVSPMRHSVCLDQATVTFRASGGEPFHTPDGKPYYHLAPPSQGGWQKIAETGDSLTLQFTQPGFFEVVGSDQTATSPKIAQVTVEPAPCQSECQLNLEPAGPLYLYVPPGEPLIPRVTVSTNSPTVGQVQWFCQGACTTQDFNTSKGKGITFFTPALGHYALLAQDDRGCNGQLEIHVANHLVSLYAGFNQKLEPTEMQTALDAFFAPHFCCTDAAFYDLIEHFRETQ